VNETALERLTAALEAHGCRVNGREAQCPIHDDGHASLSIGSMDRGDSGAVVYCHAGCDTTAVLKALGLTTADLYDQPKAKGGKAKAATAYAVVAEYAYTDAAGEVLFVVERREPKDFRQKRPNGKGGWSYKLGDTRRVLYRLPTVAAAVAEGRAVVVVEGEKDVAAVESLGMTATCSPMGAGKASKADWSPLAGAPHVLVVADKDTPGRKHAAEIRGILAGLGARASIVEAAAGKDAADHVAAGYGIGDLLTPETPHGAAVLDAVHAFLGRFVAYPSEHAHVAHTLWVAHTHLMGCWDSTPRIAFLSPEPGSGKTRALECSAPLVPEPVEAINVTPAYLFRKVGQAEVTVLYDEIDTVFGPKAKENEEIRGLLNAGHRRGAVAGRCVTKGEEVVTEDIPAYAPVALAGLGKLPDTILSRSVVVRMRRRLPSERVEPFRVRVHEPEAHKLREQLAAWAVAVADTVTATWPDMPPEVTDRDADCWEALLAVAEAAGGTWPAAARAAAVALVVESRESSPSLGVRLLADLRTVFTDAGEPSTLHVATILESLTAMDEAPWGELRGEPLKARGLANLLRPYEVHSADIKLDGTTRKGYRRADLWDAWQRYLPQTPEQASDDEPPPSGSAQSATSATSATENPSAQVSEPQAGSGRVADSGEGSGWGSGGSGRVADAPDNPLPTTESVTSGNTHQVAQVAEVADFPEPDADTDLLADLTAEEEAS
jgi:5S rRNA maturation endonuclease (ribonuclease M5)